MERSARASCPAILLANSLSPLDQPIEVADAVAAGILECLDVQLVENGVPVPERVVAHGLPSACVARCVIPKRIPAPGRRDGCA